MDSVSRKSTLRLRWFNFIGRIDDNFNFFGLGVVNYEVSKFQAFNLVIVCSIGRKREVSASD